MIEFEGFPKIPRLNRSMIVTEKIDGSNAGIIIEPAEHSFVDALDRERSTPVVVGGAQLQVAAQSRKRLVTPGKSTDLAGFAGWVWEHAPELAMLLGPGRHFGEWYGQGIQRGYGLDHKRFALFNTDRWEPLFQQPAALGDAYIHAVPVLERRDFSTVRIRDIVDGLREFGSRIPGAEGFEAEGVIVWHNAARQMFKVTTKNDERPKGSQEAA